MNVVVANVYSIYNLFNTAVHEEIDNKTLKKNLSKLMKMLIPFVPHLAYECLEQLAEKDINVWPEADPKLKTEEKIKIAIQINGKTKEIIEVKKIIFVKNKIINYLTT